MTDRRKFIIHGAGIAGVVCLSGGVLSLLNSCDSFTDKTVQPFGVNLELDVRKDLYPLILSLSKQAKYHDYIGFGIIKNVIGANYGIPVIITKTGTDIFKCFSSMCTHMNCFGDESFQDADRTKNISNIRPPVGDNIIVCQCHGSRYDASLDGKAVQGPAERSLKQYPCFYDAGTGILTIKF